MAAEKKKTGRPRKLPPNSTSVTAYLAAKERRALERIAREKGTSLSEEARRAIVFYVEFGHAYEVAIDIRLQKAAPG